MTEACIDEPHAVLLTRHLANLYRGRRFTDLKVRARTHNSFRVESKRIFLGEIGDFPDEMHSHSHTTLAS